MLPSRLLAPRVFFGSLSLLIFFSLVCCNLAQAAEAPLASATTNDASEQIVKSILQEEVALAKANLYYRLEAAKQGRWKGLRYFLFGETNASLTEAGLIVAVSERMGHITGNHFKQLNNGTLMHGNVLGGVGQTIGASGSMQEFFINGFHSLWAVHKGFSPEQAKRHEIAMTSKINSGLANFSRIAGEEENQGRVGAAEVHRKEALVLSDIRDSLVSEFDGFHVGARRKLWAQQSFYLLDSAKNVTGALGNLFGYRALHTRNRYLNQPAGVLVTISGAFIIVNPILGQLVGKAVGSLDGYLLTKSGLKRTDNALSKLQADAADLRVACERYKESGEAAVTGSVNRLDLYAVHGKRFETQLAIHDKEIRDANRIAVQSIFSGVLVGGTKLTNGIEFVIAGYKYPQNARMTNMMLGTGAIPYLAGSAYSMLDNLRIQVVGEVDRYHLGKKGELPGQLINGQLSQLDALEKSINRL